MNKYKEERDRVLSWFNEIINTMVDDDYSYLQYVALSSISWDNFSTSYGLFTIAVVAASVIQTLKYTKHEDYSYIFGDYIEIMSIPDESGIDKIPYLDPIEIIQLGLGAVNCELYIPRKRDVMGFFATLKAVIDRRKEVEEFYNIYDESEDED